MRKRKEDGLTVLTPGVLDWARSAQEAKKGGELGRLAQLTDAWGLLLGTLATLNPGFELRQETSLQEVTAAVFDAAPQLFADWREQTAAWRQRVQEQGYTDAEKAELQQNGFLPVQPVVTFSDLLDRLRGAGLLTANDELAQEAGRYFTETGAEAIRLDELLTWIEKRRKKRGRPPRHVAHVPLSETGLMLFPSNPVSGDAVSSLARSAEWERGLKGYAYGLETVRTRSDGREGRAFFGIAEGGKTEGLGEFLARGGAHMVKGWYALWGRWFRDGKQPGEYVAMDISRFCDDLGYKPHHRGGHRPENKRAAAEVLETLTSIEMSVRIPHPNRKEKDIRLAGRLWDRGLDAEVVDRYSDLFGSMREGDPQNWEPMAYVYRPGYWMSEPAFERYFTAMGQLGAGLMELDCGKDEWAVLIGGYLGTLIRVNQYRPIRLRVETVLKRVGLAQSADERRRAGRYRDKFERSLDRLKEVGVIGEWTYPEVATDEPEDLDDSDALAEYGADETAVWRGGEWRGKVIAISWPEQLNIHRARLEAATKKRVTDGQRRRAQFAKRREAQGEA